MEAAGVPDGALSLDFGEVSDGALPTAEDLGAVARALDEEFAAAAPAVPFEALSETDRAAKVAQITQQWGDRAPLVLALETQGGPLMSATGSAGYRSIPSDMDAVVERMHRRDAARNAFYAAASEGVLPRYSLDEITITIPGVSPLPEKATMQARIRWMFYAYAGASRTLLDLPGVHLAPAYLDQKGRQFWTLAKAAKALRELEVSPAQWAWWSILAWKDLYAAGKLRGGGKPKVQAPLLWVWSEKRIRKHYKWFLHEVGDGWRFQEATPTTKSVIDEWARIRNDWVRDWLPTWTAGETRLWVRRATRGFAERYEAAARQARLESEQAMQRAQAGIYVWKEAG